MFLDDQFKELIMHVFDQPDELICDSTSYLMFDLTTTILNKEFWHIWFCMLVLV